MHILCHHLRCTETYLRFLKVPVIDHYAQESGHRYCSFDTHLANFMTGRKRR